MEDMDRGGLRVGWYLDGVLGVLGVLGVMSPSQSAHPCEEMAPCEDVLAAPGKALFSQLCFLLRLHKPHPAPHAETVPGQWKSSHVDEEKIPPTGSRNSPRGARMW